MVQCFQFDIWIMVILALYYRMKRVLTTVEIATSASLIAVVVMITRILGNLLTSPIHK